MRKRGKSSFSLSGSASEGSPNVLAGNLIHNLLRKKRTCRPCPFNGKNICYDITWPPRNTLLALLGKAEGDGYVFFSFHAAIPHAESFCSLSSILRKSVQLSSVQLLSRVRLFATSWTAAHQASLSITNSQSFLKLISTESVMPSNHLVLCRPLLLLPSIFPSIRVFSNELVLCIGGQSIGVSASASVLPMNIQD